MKPYQERVIAEKNELDEKIGKLSDFIHGEDFKFIDLEEQGRLRTQLYLMQGYSGVLRDRIAAFK